jgi:hypothetical protein
MAEGGASRGFEVAHQCTDALHYYLTTICWVLTAVMVAYSQDMARRRMASQRAQVDGVVGIYAISFHHL